MGEMENITKKISREVASTLAEIRAGDIMGAYAAIWAAIIVGAAIILAQKNSSAGLVLLILSPVPILALTVLTRIALNKLAMRLQATEQNEISGDVEENKEEKPKHAELSYSLRATFVITGDYASVRVENIGDGEIRCCAKLTGLTRIKNGKRELVNLDDINPRGSFLIWDKGEESVYIKETPRTIILVGERLPLLFYGWTEKRFLLHGFDYPKDFEFEITLFRKSDSKLVEMETVKRVLNINPIVSGGGVRGYRKEWTQTLDTQQQVTEKPELKYSRFHWRAVHIQWKINADANIVNNYLLQHYVGIHIDTTIKDIRYEIDKIESFDPKEHDVFQYGFIAHGKKFGRTRIEALSEIFFITISQGKKDVSVLSFDTDTRGAHQFTVGLVRELSKAFDIELIH